MRASVRPRMELGISDGVPVSSGKGVSRSNRNRQRSTSGISTGGYWDSVVMAAGGSIALASRIFGRQADEVDLSKTWRPNFFVVEEELPSHSS